MDKIPLIETKGKYSSGGAYIKVLKSEIMIHSFRQGF